MAMQMDYTDKRVVISGCYSGMGEATAKLVGELGADIVAIDIKKPDVGQSAFHEVDLRDGDAIDQAVAEITSAGPVDRVFSCAGLPGGSFSEIDVMTVNFVALRHLNESLLGSMPRDGAICSISSGAGVGYLAAREKIGELLEITDFGGAVGWAEENLSGTGFDAYSFSKMCTILWTLKRGYAITSETGVRVNCISPGPTDTPMMPHFVEHTPEGFFDRYPKPVGRNSTPEEQAAVLAFLNSDLASYISAENLFTDGGGCAGIMTGQVDIMALLTAE